ncbi:MAG: hypothetical protein EXR53_02385 [Dehalococcoidia bacterium]|nr:hypothetical protein [Dehalococcoidia bacterium]
MERWFLRHSVERYWPVPYAQGVIDRLVACNVHTIVNYAPIAARVPPQVKLHHIDAVMALQSMTYYGISS